MVWSNGGHTQPLHVAYIDIKAAFDSVDRVALWKALRSTGAPPFLIQLIADLYTLWGTTSRVRVGGRLSQVHNPLEQPREFARDAYSPLLSFVSPWTGSCRDVRTQWGYQSDHQHSQIWTTRMMPFCSLTVNPSGRIYYHTSTPLHKHLGYTRLGRKPRFKTSAMDQHHHQLTYKGSQSKSRTNSHTSAAQSALQVGQPRKYIGESDLHHA